MNFYNLPQEIQSYIYEFDNTFHIQFKSILSDIQKIKAHRLFYLDSENKIKIKYIHIGNIDIFFSENFSSLNKIYFQSLKNLLIDEYNLKIYNIIFQKDEIFFLNTFQNKPIIKILKSWSFPTFSPYSHEN